MNTHFADTYLVLPFKGSCPFNSPDVCAHLSSTSGSSHSNRAGKHSRTETKLKLELIRFGEWVFLFLSLALLACCGISATVITGLRPKRKRTCCGPGSLRLSWERSGLDQGASCFSITGLNPKKNKGGFSWFPKKHINSKMILKTCFRFETPEQRVFLRTTQKRSCWLNRF